MTDVKEQFRPLPGRQASAAQQVARPRMLPNVGLLLLLVVASWNTEIRRIDCQYAVHFTLAVLQVARSMLKGSLSLSLPARPCTWYVQYDRFGQPE